MNYFSIFKNKLIKPIHIKFCGALSIVTKEFLFKFLNKQSIDHLLLYHLIIDIH